MNNDVNIIIASLDALSEWTLVRNSDLGHESDDNIPDDMVVGVSFAATPYRHSLCSRMEENPATQFRLKEELSKIGVSERYLNVLDWEVARPRNEDGEIDFRNVATLEILFRNPMTPYERPSFRDPDSSEPRLDVNTWDIGDERLVGEIADAGQIEPFENFTIDALMVSRPDLVGKFDYPPDPELHRGLNWPLSRGVLYDTDTAEVGGQPVPGDGSYYIPRHAPYTFVLVSRLVRFKYLSSQPPVTGSLPSGLISVASP